MSNIFIGLKKTCLGVLDRGDRDKYNETGLKEGGGIEMSTAVLFHIRDAPLSFAFVLLTWIGRIANSVIYRRFTNTTTCSKHSD